MFYFFFFSVKLGKIFLIHGKRQVETKQKTNVQERAPLYSHNILMYNVLWPTSDFGLYSVYIVNLLRYKIKSQIV